MPDMNHTLTGVIATSITSATHSASVVTITAPTNAVNTIYVVGFWISCSGTPSATVSVTLADGATTIVKFEIPPSAFAPIRGNYGTHPLRITPGQNAVLTLPDLGSGIVGTAGLEYYIGTI